MQQDFKRSSLLPFYIDRTTTLRLSLLYLMSNFNEGPFSYLDIEPIIEILFYLFFHKDDELFFVNLTIKGFQSLRHFSSMPTL